MAFPAPFNGALYRTKITLGGIGELPATQSDFPLMLSDQLAGRIPAAVYNTALGTPAQSGGGDLLLSSDINGSIRLPLDVRACAPASGGGPFQVRGGMPTASAGDSVYLWWGSAGSPSQPAPADPYGRDAVYAAAFTAMWACEGDPGGGAPQLVDRTGTGNDGTAFGMSSGDLVSGHIGNGWSVAGGSKYAQCPGVALNNANFTWSGWYQHDNGSGVVGMLVSKFNTSASRWEMFIEADDTLRTVSQSSTAVDGAVVLTSGVWYRIAYTYDGTTHRLYVDTTADGTSTVAGPTPSNPVQHGSRSGAAGSDFSGILDEIWTRNDVLPPDDLTAHYNNESSATFATNDGVTVLAAAVAPRFPFYYWYQ